MTETVDFTEELIRCGVPQEFHDEFRAMGLGTLIPKLNIIFEELTAERAVATMPVAGNTQAVGFLHGGATAALIETLGSFAANVAAGSRRVAVGSEISVSHLRPGLQGRVRAVCTAYKIGRTQCVHHIEVRDEQDRLISVGRMTNSFISRPQS